MNFSQVLISWYDQNKRDLPWRSIDNPYVIWIAEVVFQQTRIAQGLPFFHSFMKEFPTVYALASANEELVLKKWQGLGYYSRARNLHFSAKYIVNELNGVMPNSYNELLKLKGVGPYIAAEVASVCYKEVVAAVDGNVHRVVSRYFGVTEAVNSTVGAKLIQQLATNHIDESRPGDFNQALMDFGSGVCSFKNPSCLTCVFSETCWAYRNNKVSVLPVKLKKVKIRDRFFNYFIPNGGEVLYLNKRGEGDVWQGLFQLPLLETNVAFTGSEIEGVELSYLLYSTKRVLSHQRIWIKFWVVPNIVDTSLLKHCERIRIDEIEKYPVPKSIEQLFSSLEFTSLFNGS